MAWKARVIRIVPDDNELRSLIDIGFYDDSLPLSQSGQPRWLYRKAYSSDEMTSAQDLQNTVIADGQAARAAYNRVQAVKQALPIGREIAIP